MLLLADNSRDRLDNVVDQVSESLDAVFEILTVERGDKLTFEFPRSRLGASLRTMLGAVTLIGLRAQDSNPRQFPDTPNKFPDMRIEFPVPRFREFARN